MSFAHGAHAGGSCVHKDALGNTDLDTVRGGAGLLMTKRIFFYCLLPSLDTSTWRTPQSHPLSLPFSCRQTLLFEFRYDSVSSSTPSSRLYRRRRAYSYGQSVSSRSTIRSTSEPSMVYAAVIRTTTVRNRRRHDQSGRDCGILGPLAEELEALPTLPVQMLATPLARIVGSFGLGTW